MENAGRLDENLNVLLKKMIVLKQLRDEVTRGEDRVDRWQKNVQAKERDMEEMQKQIESLRRGCYPNDFLTRLKLNMKVTKSLRVVTNLTTEGEFKVVGLKVGLRHGVTAGPQKTQMHSDGNSESLQKFLIEMETEAPLRFSHDQLRAISSDFQFEIGSGGFAHVYKGQLPNGLQVAIKVPYGSYGREYVIDKTFIAELSIMGRIKHRNILRLFGFCSDVNFKALVYEYMERGSLDGILSQNHYNIEWEILYDISIQTAKGLSYLHEACDPPIIHGDVKPANVLLDSNFCPKITDFGLSSRIRPDSDETGSQGTVITRSFIRGTRGYMAPEIFSLERVMVTNKSDVFSFGMSLFDILGSKRVGNREKWFPQQVWSMFEKGQLDELIFNCGIKEEDKESVKTLCMTALLCVQFRPIDRPSMSTVIKILEGYMHIRSSQLVNPFPYYDSESSLGGGSTHSYQHIISTDFHRRLHEHEGSIEDTEEDFTHTEFGSSSMSRQPLGGTGTPADVMINSIKIDSDTTTTSELQASTQKELEEYFEKVPVSPTPRSSPTIASIHEELKKHFKNLENSVVIYTTSLGAISKTVEECDKVRKILLSHNIQMSEHDLWTNPEYREELKKLLGEKDIKFPVVFVKGRLIGGADKVQKLEEDNELGTLFDGIPSATTLV